MSLGVIAWVRKCAGGEAIIAAGSVCVFVWVHRYGCDCVSVGATVGV